MQKLFLLILIGKLTIILTAKHNINETYCPTENNQHFFFNKKKPGRLGKHLYKYI